MPFSNNTVLIPNATVARKPDLREVGSKKQPRAEVLVAVNRGFGHDSGADWFQVVCWGKVAETVARYLDKGARISVSGHLRGDFYETKDGQKRRSTEIVADSVQFLSRARGASEAA